MLFQAKCNSKSRIYWRNWISFDTNPSIFEANSCILAQFFSCVLLVPNNMHKTWMDSCLSGFNAILVYNNAVEALFPVMMQYLRKSIPLSLLSKYAKLTKFIWPQKALVWRINTAYSVATRFFNMGAKGNATTKTCGVNISPLQPIHLHLSIQLPTLQLYLSFLLSLYNRLSCPVPLCPSILFCFPLLTRLSWVRCITPRKNVFTDVYRCS